MVVVLAFLVLVLVLLPALPDWGQWGGPPEPSPPPASAPAMTSAAGLNGFEMLVPDGWTRRTEGSSVFYESQDGDSYVQIDQTDHPTDDELDHVLGQEKASIEEDRLPGYERVRITDATEGSGFHSVVDWEFTWYKDGRHRHVLARNIAVRPGEHLTLAWAAPEAQWEEQAAQREAGLGSLKPA